MGQDGAVAATTAGASPELPQAASAGPCGMKTIFFVLWTSCQWNALRETGLCSSSSANRRFQEWVQAGVFAGRGLDFGLLGLYQPA